MKFSERKIFTALISCVLLMDFASNVGFICVEFLDSVKYFLYRLNWVGVNFGLSSFTSFCIDFLSKKKEILCQELTKR